MERRDKEYGLYIDHRIQREFGKQHSEYIVITLIIYRNYENNDKAFLTGCCAAMIGMTTGCSKSPLNPLGSCFSGSWILEGESDLTNWNAAATDYANDPTPANCAKYKSAGQELYRCLRFICKLCTRG